jgi:CMP-N,N'-diacetyllegionaminic acid synthase
MSIIHCFQATEKITGQRYDIIVELDVTSPLRSPDDIKNVVDLLQEDKVSNEIIGSPACRSLYFNMMELNENGIASLLKKPANKLFSRQDPSKCYDMNVAICVWKSECLL